MRVRIMSSVVVVAVLVVIMPVLVVANCTSLGNEFTCPYTSMKYEPAEVEQPFIETSGFVYLSFEQVTNSTMVSAIRLPANASLDNENERDDQFNKYYGNFTARALCARDGSSDARCYSTTQSTFQNMVFNEDCTALSFTSWKFTVDPRQPTPENYFGYEYITQTMCEIDGGLSPSSEEETPEPAFQDDNGCEGGRPSGVYSCVASSISYTDGQFVPLEEEFGFVFSPLADSPSPVFLVETAHDMTQAPSAENDELLEDSIGGYSNPAMCAIDASSPDRFMCTDATDASANYFSVLGDTCEALTFVGGEALVEVNATIQEMYFGAPFAHTGVCVKGDGSDALDAARMMTMELEDNRSCDPAPTYDCSYYSLKKDMVSGSLVEVQGTGVVELSGTFPTFIRTFTREGLYLNDGNLASDVFAKYAGSEFSAACAYAMDADPSHEPVAYCWQVTQGASSVLTFSDDCTELSIFTGEPLLDAPDNDAESTYDFEYPLAGIIQCSASS